IPSGMTLQSTTGAASTIIDATGANTRALHCDGNFSTTLIEGFTITGGHYTAATLANAFGGGILTENSDATTISRCIITGNVAQGYAGVSSTNNAGGYAAGGGVYAQATQTKLVNCVISGNSALGGNGWSSLSNPYNGGDGGNAVGGGVDGAIS